MFWGETVKTMELRRAEGGERRASAHIDLICVHGLKEAVDG